MRKLKKVALNNGVKVRHDREGTFDALCIAHSVDYKTEDGTTVLILTDQSIALLAFSDRLRFVLTGPEDVLNTIYNNLLALEV